MSWGEAQGPQSSAEQEDGSSDCTVESWYCPTPKQLDNHDSISSHVPCYHPYYRLLLGEGSIQCRVEDWVHCCNAAATLRGIPFKGLCIMRMYLT